MTSLEPQTLIKQHVDNRSSPCLGVSTVRNVVLGSENDHQHCNTFLGTVIDVIRVVYGVGTASDN